MAEGNCVPGPDHPCRVNLDLMPHDTTLWMWLLTLVALGVFAYGVWQMVHVWRLGRAWPAGNAWRGLARLAGRLMTHSRFMRDRQPGTMHAWIFFGFLVLFIGTTLAFVDYDVFELLLDSKLLQGRGYLYYEAALDFFGVLLILGVGMALWRRLAARPPHLHVSDHPEVPGVGAPGGDGAPRAAANKARGPRGDLYALWMLLAIAVTGFFLEAMRLVHQVRVDNIAHASWSPVGHALGPAVSWMGEAQMAQVYPVAWWVHFALWTSVLAVLPWTKFKHIITSSLNIMFHDDARQARAALPTPFSLKQIMASESHDMPAVGYTTIRDFTWKDRLALDACTNCGRCEWQCPATAAGRPLSPRKLIQDLKAHMWQDYRAGNAAAHAGREHQAANLTQVSDLAVQIEEATLWSCTTCRACMTECPVDIEHVDIIVEMRRGLVNASRLDEHQQKLLVNITNAGNPYGFPASDRDAWRAGLPTAVLAPTAEERAAEGKPFEWLWWVGCVGSFDPRNQQVTRALATLFNAAGLDFAILAGEKCNGDPARRLGEEGRFQQSALENLAAMEALGVSKVVAQCPHCFNTLAREYPEFGAKFEVVHHSQLLERLVAEGRLRLRTGAPGASATPSPAAGDLAAPGATPEPVGDGGDQPPGPAGPDTEARSSGGTGGHGAAPGNGSAAAHAMPGAITFHDSCYLGRHNGIFDAPRAVLRASGLPMVEMDQSRSTGMCCGAGGSNMWYEIKQETERINVLRAKQAAATGASTVASACPFCLTMLHDGIGLTGQEGAMQAKDIAEILVAHLDWTPPAVAEQAGSSASSADAPAWQG